ncbi:MAG: hypothetical protein HYY06_29080 [Deltaproteobacteria bacterium]|nr:hypothetical protein [Deltaproteobacteria bacterium]
MVAEPVGAGSPAAAPIDPGVAVPGAMPPSLPGGFDVSELMYLASRSADTQIQVSGQKAASVRDRVAALRKAIESARHGKSRRERDSGFWSRIASVAKAVAVVASVAGAAVSGGSSLAIAAAILTAGSAASGGTLWLDKLGMSKEAAGYVALAATVAVGGAAAATAASAATATATVPSSAETVAIGGAKAVEVGAKGTGIVANYNAEVADADATKFAASAQASLAKERMAKADRREAVREIRRAADLKRRVVRLAQDIIEGQRRASMAALRV